MTLDYAKISNVQLANVHRCDHPDYSDAFVESAEYQGREMTEAELELLNTDGCYINQCVFEGK